MDKGVVRMLDPRDQLISLNVIWAGAMVRHKAGPPREVSRLASAASGRPKRSEPGEGQPV